MNNILTYEADAWLAVAAYSLVSGNKITNIDPFGGSVGLSQEQLQWFNNRYQVEYSFFEDVTGFGATLFWDTELQRQVIAIRGTEPTTFKDILNDAFLGTGKAYEQEVALEAFYRRLTTSVADGGLGLLSTNTVVDVTGHSLGGFLTQVFTAKHPSIVNQAYTYNAPGIDGVWGNIKALFSASSSAYPNSKITNIAARDGLTFVADIGINFGSQDIEFPNSGHSSVTLANTISFYSVFATLDPNITINEITRFYDMTVESGRDPVVNSLKILSNIFQIPNQSNTADMEVIFKNYAKNKGYTNLNVDFLIDKSPAQLQSKSIGNLYALSKLNPFAIEGNLPTYANLNRTDMSAKYIEDRAQYLYYLLDKTNRYDVDPTLSMTYYADAALGSDYTLSQTFSRSRVLFGGEGNSTLRGGDYNDRLYGMGGEDTLTGNGGNDYMEGGTGFDRYITGSGDTIMDSDGNGRVAFEGGILTGGKAKEGEKGVYEGNGGTYSLSNGTLTFVKGSQTLTIQKFTNGDLGIVLGNDKPKPSPYTPKPDFPSPLILDLNGDGITSTFISETSTYFDLDNDGVRQRTGWVQATDALLVLDKNQDGIINNGTELFGNHTILKNGTKAANGFEALKEYDENKDGIIDTKDTIYNSLQLWQDSNSDGVTDTEELHTLQEMEVTSINLGYSTNTDTLEERNSIRQTSTFTTATGETKAINDVWFMTESSDTARDTNAILKNTVAALPDFRGAGRAENLSTAMNSNTALETAVTALLAKSTTATYSSLLGDAKNILALWTHTDNISATATRGEQWIMNHNYDNAQPVYRYQVYAYARDVAILETFWGQNFTMNVDDKTTSDVIGTEMSNYMTNAINTLTDTLLATLLVQELYGKEAYDVTQGKFDYSALFAKLDSTLTIGTTADKTTASNLLTTLIHRDGLETLSHLDTALLSESAFKTLLKANGIIYTLGADGSISGSYKDTVAGGNGDDKLYATDSGTVYGGAGDDIIRGTDASNVYSNATGHEELHGGEGNDIIIGNSGSDMLYGDEGNDTLYANGTSSGDGNYGHDVLIGGRGSDTLVGTGRNSTYIYTYGDGFDTIIDGGNVGLTPDVLELRGIRFEDIRVGRSSNDMVISIKDALNETSDSGSITIKNGYGSGKIENFIFDDMTMNFTQIQYSDDTYTFNTGDGVKTIHDLGSFKGDILRFGEGITAEDIEIKVSPASNDLIIALKEEGKTFSTLNDKLTITNWFNPDNRIESFSFSNGTTWDTNTILAHQGTDEADTVRVLNSNADTTLYLGAGNDIITTGNGNDTLIGGTGNDTLNGGAGNDTYTFAIGDGADTIIDPNGNDTLTFGKGISASDIISKIAANGLDLIVAIKEDGVAFDDLSDKITLTNWLIPISRIESFSFSDGTVWGVDNIFGTQATEGNDIVSFVATGEPTTISMLGGNDYVITGSGNDLIDGGSGNDIISTGTGNDTLIGGTGNDSLQGGAGNDTYKFAKGDGQDTILDEDRYVPYYWTPSFTQTRDGGNDTLSFADGISTSDIITKAAVNGLDLIVAIKDGVKPFDQLSDKITLKNWFDPNNRIETFTFSDGIIWSVNDIIAAQVTEGNDVFRPIDLNTATTIHLLGGDDTATTGNANDSVYGDSGSDTIQTQGGDDTQSGGTGNDTLQGGAGNDTYLFNRGDGIDTVLDIAGTDQISFGGNITKDDIIIRASSNGTDLIIAIKDGTKTFDQLTDKVILKNWFVPNSKIETLSFSNGTTLDISAVVSTNFNDVINAPANSTIDAMGGNDMIVTVGGTNTIIGGTGNDTINGGIGNDIYVFRRGDGHDTITDIGGTDILKLGANISDIAIKASADNNDLIVAIKDANKLFDQLGDTIVLKNWFINVNRIETFTCNDGSLDINQIANMQGTDGNDKVHLLYKSYWDANMSFQGGDDYIDISNSHHNNNIIDGGDGNDTILGGLGDDTLLGGAGDDILNGGQGVNTLDGGAGNDILYENFGGDILKGGTGNDLIYNGNYISNKIIFGLGDGHDTVTTGYGSHITITFTVGISSTSIIAQSHGSDLIIGLKEDGVDFSLLKDTITLKDYFKDTTVYNNLLFENESGISISSLLTNIPTEGNDVLTGTPSNDTIDGLAGDDRIYGGNGNDTLYGGDGNDFIDGGYGDDIFVGGKGNDTFHTIGRYAYDVFIFNKGDGQDKIFEELDPRIGHQNTFKFGDKITQNDLIIKRDGLSLIIAIKEDGVEFKDLNDKITIMQAYEYSMYEPTVRFSNGQEFNILESMKLASQVGDSIVLNSAQEDSESINLTIDQLLSTVTRLDKTNLTITDLKSDSGTLINNNDGTWRLMPNTNYNGIITLSYGISDGVLPISSTATLNIISVNDTPTFALNNGIGSGIVTTSFGATSSEGESVAVLPDGKIIVAGQYNDGFALARYNFDGSLDTSFGINGKITTNLPDSINRLWNMSQQADGKIVVAGTTFDSLWKGDFIVARYNIDGSLDETFGVGGIVSTDIAGDDRGFGIDIQSDGKILVSGNGDNSLKVVRYNSNGTLDETFGVNGKIIDAGFGGGYTLVIQPDGKFILPSETNEDFTLARYNSDGSIDETFGINGKVTTDIGAYDHTWNVTLQPDGKILLSGNTFDLKNSLIALVRYNADGRLDSTFGNNGIVTTSASSNNTATGVAVQEDGKIVLSSWSYNSLGKNYDFGLVRYNTDGSLDQTFGNSGIVLTDIHSGSSDIAQYITLQPDGKIIITGGSAGNFATVRYNSDGSLDTSFGLESSLNDTANYTLGGSAVTLDANAAIYDAKLSSINNYNGSTLILARHNGASMQDQFSGAGIVSGQSNGDVTVSNTTIGTYSYVDGSLSVAFNDNATQALVNQALQSIAYSNTTITPPVNVQIDWIFNDGNTGVQGSNGTLSTLGSSFVNIVASTSLTGPIVLDLNHDAITSVSLGTSHTYFDYAGDGLKEHTGWIEQGDALLVADLNNDGIINDGSELFGDHTKLKNGTLASDGYTALAQYDSNGDGIIDKNDTDFSRLQIWKDANGNGKTDSGELITLTDAGITSLSLNRTDGSVYTQTFEEGNTITNETSYTEVTSSGIMRDVWFNTDPADTITDNDTVYSTSKDETLSGGVGNDTYVYVANGGNAIIDDNGNGVDTLRFGSTITPDSLRIIWMQGSADILVIFKDSEQESILIKGWYTPENKIEQFSFSDGTLWNAQDILNAMGSEDDDVYDGFKDQANIIHANGGSDMVSTFGFDDILDGGNGDDALDSGAGNDTLIGAEGNDLLFGGEGDDTYQFDRGFGKDMIYDSTADGSNGGNDRIVLGNGISYNDVIVKSFENDNNLYIAINEANKTFDELSNVITIKDWFLSNNRIESIVFSDSSEISIADLIRGKASDNHEAIVALSDQGGDLVGTKSNDTLIGNIGNDIILGFERDDTLVGNDGDDILIGGKGNDTQGGGAGNDSYFFERGDGKDTIYDNATATQVQYGYVTDSDGVARWSKIEKEYSVDGGSDILYFGEGIIVEDLILSREGSDLLIVLKDSSGDELRIQDYYQANNVIEFFGFSDETILTIDDINGLMNQAPEAPSEVTNILQNIRVFSGNVGATDIDGNILTYAVSTQAAHGTLSVDETGVWSYAATDAYMGTDSAIITIDDSNGGVITQTLNFDVKVSAPTLADSTSGLLEDTSTKGVFNVTNPIGGVLLYEVLGASSKGAFSVNEAGEWSYAPNADLNGSDSVTIKVTNAYGLSTTATLNLAIEAVNDAPILTETPSPIILNAGASANGSIKASDIDGDTLSYSVTSTPEHGTLSINEKGEWNYSAKRYYAGESSATISIDDGHGGSVITTLNFTSLMTPDWHYTYGGQSMTINDSDGQDLLIMDTISMGDLTFLQDGNNLRIDVKDKNDIILTDYFTSPTKGVELLQTKEGMINLSKERIGTIGNFWNFGWGSNKADLISGKSSADTIYAGEGNDVIFGNAGNDALSGSNDNDLLIGGKGHDTLSGGNNDDILYGDNGNDTLSGEAGNDKLFGDKGNDSLSGGEGNDLLNGGEGTNSLSGSSGNDTYLFTKWATDTTINENMFGFNLFGRWIGQNGGNDIVKFGEGITKEDISFLMKGNDLLLQYGDSEFITIQNQKNEGNQIEKIELSDGSYLTNTDMDKIIQQLSAYSKDHGFHINNNSQIQNNQALMNIVAGAWHQ